MAIFTKQKLSGSTDGKIIKVGAIVTPGTLIHTAVAGTTSFDEVWLYVINTSGSTAKLTIEFGGVISPDDLIEVNIPAESGLIQVLPGVLLNNSNVIRAFADIADILNIIGWINSIV